MYQVFSFEIFQDIENRIGFGNTEKLIFAPSRKSALLKVCKLVFLQIISSKTMTLEKCF